MRTITGLFDSRPEAERAVETLVQQLGLERARIQVQAAGPVNATAGTDAPRDESHHGFKAAGGTQPGILVSMLVPEDQAAAAKEALASNGGRTAGPDAGA
jgi:hypothetical protein